MNWINKYIELWNYLKVTKKLFFLYNGSFVTFSIAWGNKLEKENSICNKLQKAIIRVSFFFFVYVSWSFKFGDCDTRTLSATETDQLSISFGEQG